MPDLCCSPGPLRHCLLTPRNHHPRRASAYATTSGFDASPPIARLTSPLHLSHFPNAILFQAFLNYLIEKRHPQSILLPHFSLSSQDLTTSQYIFVVLLSLPLEDKLNESEDLIAFTIIFRLQNSICSIHLCCMKSQVIKLKKFFTEGKWI